MSNPELEPGQVALGRLNQAFETLLAHHAAEKARADRAEGELRELEQLLKAFEIGTESPKGLRDRVDVLETEREDLMARMVRGRETVQRVMDRIRFLEERK